MQPSLSMLPRPAFAHYSDTTQGANQALNFFAHHNNFTNVSQTTMNMANDQITAGAWAITSVLLFIYVLILLNRNYDYMDCSDSDRNSEQREEERIPFLAQEEKSV
ncbi:hypothetical protein BCON_0005g00350 [Botryotinia convoluta]|uniref:Copper transporter n=1 Tax=Botryotinia convoluta TaxID=54673 RepID=A0A4Z1ITP5_9HELO|nr:hypothetical protein BCON_0005g00350 [Botryotinia convoluta]